MSHAWGRKQYTKRCFRMFAGEDVSTRQAMQVAELPQHALMCLVSFPKQTVEDNGTNQIKSSEIAADSSASCFTTRTTEY